MRAILSVTVREGYKIADENESRILYHSRKGLTPDRSKATKFKTLDYAIRAARKKYSSRLAPLHATESYYSSRDLQSWSATTIEEER